jgi:hypothetical protein
MDNARPFLAVEGRQIVLPKGPQDAVARAQPMSVDWRFQASLDWLSASWAKATHNDSGTGLISINAAGVEAQYWLIASFVPVAGVNGQRSDVGDDCLKIKGQSVDPAVLARIPINIERATGGIIPRSSVVFKTQ